MGKRYKKGNRKKKPSKPTDGFYQREKKLNQLINKFVNNFFKLKRPAIREEYDDMNKLRLDIKSFFALQEDEIWRQSRRRRRIYYQQLARFKHYYVNWKHLTYYVYLELRYNCPLHLSQTLIYYIKNTHDITSTIYML